MVGIISHLSRGGGMCAGCVVGIVNILMMLTYTTPYITIIQQATEQDAQMHPDFDLYIQPRDTHNILRPETVESLFYLWRVTKDPVYREWGWRIFQAFEAHSKVRACVCACGCVSCL